MSVPHLFLNHQVAIYGLNWVVLLKEVIDISGVDFKVVAPKTGVNSLIDKVRMWWI